MAEIVHRVDIHTGGKYRLVLLMLDDGMIAFRILKRPAGDEPPTFATAKVPIMLEDLRKLADRHDRARVWETPPIAFALIDKRAWVFLDGEACGFASRDTFRSAITLFLGDPAVKCLLARKP